MSLIVHFRKVTGDGKATKEETKTIKSWSELSSAMAEFCKDFERTDVQVRCLRQGIRSEYEVTITPITTP